MNFKIHKASIDKVMADNMQKPDKLFNWKYITFVALQTLNFTMFYICFPVIPKYAVSRGLSLGQAGMLAGGFAIASLVARPLAGYFNDHFDRKPIMIVALVLCGGATAGLSFTGSVTLLLILRLLFGASYSFFTTMLVSCATDFIPEKNMAEGIGYIGLGVAIAAAIGPPVGLAVFDIVGAEKLFLIMSVVYLISAAIVILEPVLRKEACSSKENFSLFNFIEKNAVFYASLVIPFAFSTGFFNSFISLTAEERGIEGIGSFFTVYAIVMMGLKPMSGKIQDRFGLSYVLIPAFFFTSLANGIVSFSQSLVLMLVAAVFLAFGQGAGQPSLQAQCVKSADTRRRGVAISTYYLGQDVGNGIGNIAGASVAASLGYNGAYLFCAGLLLLGLFAYVLREMKMRKSL
ncbi:MAG: MFS transporter [Pseudobutyrivibrio sp.]|nr:MFS transporter [Pseudobutyrivibrio sp.]